MDLKIRNLKYGITIMIEDKELRDLFKIESEEHLLHLETGLLRLEKEPANRAILDDVFREAHSLKGAARMVGLSVIETISHHLENILGAAKKGETILDADVVERMYHSLDAIRRLAHEAVTGEPAHVDTSAVLAQLQPPEKQIIRDETSAEYGMRNEESREEINAECGTGSAEVKSEITATGIQTQQQETGESEIHNQKSKIEEFRIETIRVATRALDTLMTLLGELSVTKTRVARRSADIEEIVELWEKLNRSNAERRMRNAELKAKIPHNANEDSSLHIPHSAFEQVGILLNKLKSAANEDYSKFDYVAGELENGIRTIRLLPLSTVFSLFPRMVRDIARSQSKEVQLVVEGGETNADKRILEEMKDPLMHMIRNAIDHGIEIPNEREQKNKPRMGTIKLTAYQTALNVVIEVKDDGRGLDIEAIKRTALKQKLRREEELAAMTPAQVQSLILISGFSTSSFVTDFSGRGVGLDVVRTNVERLKGTIQFKSTPGMGCTFRVQLPVTLATSRVLIVAVSGIKYAVPVEHVQTTSLVARREIFTLEGRETIVLDTQPVSVARLSDILELKIPQSTTPNPKSAIQNPKSEMPVIPCIILSVGDERLGILVDELLDEREIVLKPQGMILKRVRNVSGATILETGEVCMILNPQDLIKSVKKREIQVAREKPAEVVEKKKMILLAEDSITTRTQMKRILDGAGYVVVTAVDGLDAFNKLGAQSFDALVSDILMPNMDGLTLTAKVRQDKKYKELPVVLVTSLASDEDKKKGLEAGANAYITKPAFDQKALLETLKRLI